MPQPLRAVDPARHEVTRKAVKRWRSDADKMKLKTSNQSDSGARRLPVDEILKRTEREMPKIRSHKRPFWLIQFGYAVLVLVLLILTFGALLIVGEALR